MEEVTLPPPPPSETRLAAESIIGPPPTHEYRPTIIGPPPTHEYRPTIVLPPPPPDSRPTVVEPPPSAPWSLAFSPPLPSFIGPPPSDEPKEPTSPPPPVDSLQVTLPESGKITISCSRDTPVEEVEQRLLKKLTKRGLSPESPGVAEWLQALLYAWSSKTMRRVEYGPVTLWQWTPPQLDVAEGKEVCSRCRTTLGFTANFCSACGLEVPENLKEPKGKARPVKTTPDLFKCEGCGYMLMAQTRFCTGCGVAVVDEGLTVCKALNDINDKTLRFALMKLSRGHGLTVVKGGSRLSGKFVYPTLIKELCKFTRPGFLVMDYRYAMGQAEKKQKCFVCLAWLPQPNEATTDAARVELIRNRLNDFPQKVVWLCGSTPDQLNEACLQELCG